MKNKKVNVKALVIDFMVITIGAFIAAAAIYFFMLPSGVIIGSGSALAKVIRVLLLDYVDLPVSLINLAINVILIVIGVITVGPEFGTKTIYAEPLRCWASCWAWRSEPMHWLLTAKALTPKRRISWHRWEITGFRPCTAWVTWAVMSSAGIPTIPRCLIC